MYVYMNNWNRVSSISYCTISKKYIQSYCSTFKTVKLISGFRHYQSDPFINDILVNLSQWISPTVKKETKENKYLLPSTIISLEVAKWWFLNSKICPFFIIFSTTNLASSSILFSKMQSILERQDKCCHLLLLSNI